MGGTSGPNEVRSGELGACRRRRSTRSSARLLSDPSVLPDHPPPTMDGAAVTTEGEGDAPRERRTRGERTTTRGEKHDAVGEPCGERRSGERGRRLMRSEGGIDSEESRVSGRARGQRCAMARSSDELECAKRRNRDESKRFGEGPAWFGFASSRVRGPEGPARGSRHGYASLSTPIRALRRARRTNKVSRSRSRAKPVCARLKRSVASERAPLVSPDLKSSVFDVGATRRQIERSTLTVSQVTAGEHLRQGLRAARVSTVFTRGDCLAPSAAAGVPNCVDGLRGRSEFCGTLSGVRRLGDESARICGWRSHRPSHTCCDGLVPGVWLRRARAMAQLAPRSQLPFAPAADGEHVQAHTVVLGTQAIVISQVIIGQASCAIGSCGPQQARQVDVEYCDHARGR